MNMPDNESNRTSAEWDSFADQMFQAVIKDIDKKSGKPGTPSIKL
jgi:hypothetical protein